jgi:hypothetical protein
MGSVTRPQSRCKQGAAALAAAPSFYKANLNVESSA